MSERETKNYIHSASQSARFESGDQYNLRENEGASLRIRVSKALGVMGLVFLLFWVLSIWRWPFSFLGDYIQLFFLTFVALGYTTCVLSAKTVRSVLGGLQRLQSNL